MMLSTVVPPENSVLQHRV